MGALPGGRSDLRAHAQRPHGLRMEGGCTLARSLEAARTSGARSSLTAAPEQITFGPTEEEGIALAPDGRSLVTSIGMRRSAIWIHDAAGERAISSEGYGGAPRLSADGTRVFYLLARDWKLSAAGWTAASSELRSVDLASGKTDSMLPGVFVSDYDVSRDEKEVAFTTTEAGGLSQIWLASLNRRTAPRRIARGGDQVSFGSDGDLIFRSLDETTNHVGSHQERWDCTRTGDDHAHSRKGAVSADGEWVIAILPGAAKVDRVNAAPSRYRSAAALLSRICGDCSPSWSSDGRFFYVGSPRTRIRDIAGSDVGDSRAGGEVTAGFTRVRTRTGWRWL